jgi:FKBP-type peptidyl-prolyl cis-trans isomerase
MNKNYITIIIILVLAVSTLSIAVINDRNGSEISRLNVDNSTTTEISTEDEIVEEVENQEVINNETTNNMSEEQNNNQPESGLGIEVVTAGSGAEAENGKTVSVHYTGKFEDGTVFDSSIQRGIPIEFVLGAGMVIQGWEKGILGMKVGEKRVLTIPSDLGYGEMGAGPIPGGATLIFDVELVDVK